jgi:hypothetical protein
MPRFSFTYFQNHGSGGMPPEDNVLGSLLFPIIIIISKKE